MFRYVPLWFMAIGGLFWILNGLAVTLDGGTIDMLVANSPTGAERDKKIRKETAIAIVEAVQSQSNCGYLFRVCLKYMLPFYTALLISLSMMYFIDIPLTHFPTALPEVLSLLWYVLDTPVTERGEGGLLWIFPRVATYEVFVIGPGGNPNNHSVVCLHSTAAITETLFLLCLIAVLLSLCFMTIDFFCMMVFFKLFTLSSDKKINDKTWRNYCDHVVLFLLKKNLDRNLMKEIWKQFPSNGKDVVLDEIVIK